MPELPRYRMNMYVADGPNREIADVFSRLIRTAFAEHNDHADKKGKPGQDELRLVT